MDADNLIAAGKVVGKGAYIAGKFIGKTGLKAGKFLGNAGMAAIDAYNTPIEQAMPISREANPLLAPLPPDLDDALEGWEDACYG